MKANKRIAPLSSPTRMLASFFAAALCLQFIGCTEQSSQPQTQAAPKPPKSASAPQVEIEPLPGRQLEITCYFPSWAKSADDVPYDKVDKIYYSFLRPTPDGGFEPLANPELLKELVRRCREADVKVAIAVGGALPHIAPAFEAITADPEIRATFIQNIVDFVEEYDLDGVDIDWEYPIAGVSDQNCALLMQELHTELHPRGKLLSIAVPGDSREPRFPPSIFPVIDYLNVMTYDRGRPLHSTMEYARDGIAYWTGMGCPPDKIMLGVPFYSRSETAEPLTYKEMLRQGADADSDLFTDREGNVHGYNGRSTLREKVKHAQANSIRGIMIWEISQDSRDEYSLLQTIYETARNQP